MMVVLLSCQDLYTENTMDEIAGFGGNVPALRFAFGIFSVVGMMLMIFWIRKQARAARQGDAGATENVIFPMFVYLMWWIALCDVYEGVISMTIHVEPRGRNSRRCV